MTLAGRDLYGKVVEQVDVFGFELVRDDGGLVGSLARETIGLSLRSVLAVTASRHRPRSNHTDVTPVEDHPQG